MARDGYDKQGTTFDQASREATGARPYGRYLEDFEEGAIYKHWPAKTVTEADDHLFCLITMNHHPLHMNDVYAAQSQQGRNVVVGPLVYSLALGMSVATSRGRRSPISRRRSSVIPRRSSTATRSTPSPRCSRLAGPSPSPIGASSGSVPTSTTSATSWSRRSSEQCWCPAGRKGRNPSRNADNRVDAAESPHSPRTGVGSSLSERHGNNAAGGPPRTHARLQAWVEEVAALTQPSEIHWCDGSAEEYDSLCRELVEARHVRAALRRQAAQLLPGPFGPRRRRARRGPHVHLLERERTPGPTNNWRDPEEMRDALTELFRGVDAGPHDVRGALLDGPAGVADRPHRRAAHRLRVRRGQHADHDPHGQGRARRAGRRTATSSRACTRSASRSPTGARTCRGRATPRTSTSCTSPRPRDLVLRLGLRRQRAARQEVLRAADRLGDGARRGLDGRAHADPQAHLARGRDQVRDGRVPVRLRQDQPRDADPDPSRAGRSRRSATTSRG